MKQRYGWMAAILLCALLTFAAAPQPALAATFTAATANDLIANITQANLNSNANTIILTADITLTNVAASDNSGNSGLPAISSDITIEGQGHFIKRSVNAPNFRIAHVSSGSLTLVNTTISNGNTGSAGGAIMNAATLVINHSTLSGNAGDNGGAIYNSGMLVVNNSTISGNAANFGGAVYSDNPASSEAISNTIISGNSAVRSGSAFDIYGGSLIINNSTLSGNSVTDVNFFVGGGIHNYGGAITINRSTIVNNTSAYYGGAIYQEGGSTTINNSTFSGNRALQVGGIMDGGGTLTINYSTIVGNSSSADNQNGMFTYNPPFATTTITSSIVANNPGGNCFGIFTSDFSLDNDGSCSGFSSGFTSSPTINLAALSDNGGSTQSVALNAGSSALDAANPATCPGTDQRGVARSIDANGTPNNPATGDCDIGAFESGGVLRTLQFTTASSSFNWGAAASIPIKLSLDAPLPANYGSVAAYVWVTGGTATAGTEYAPFGMQTAVFSAGDQTKVVNINLLNVSLTTDKTVVLHFATTNGPGFNGPAHLGTQLTHTVTLKASLPNAAPDRNYFTVSTPTLTWNRITQAVRYEIAIASNNAFSGATMYDAGNNLAFTWPVTLTSGTYYWHVRACADATEASCGAWSTSDTFVVFAG